MTIQNPSVSIPTNIGTVEFAFRLDDNGKVIASFQFGRNSDGPPCVVNGIVCNGWGEVKYNGAYGYLYCHLSVYRGSDGYSGCDMTRNGSEKIQKEVIHCFNTYVADNGDVLRTECADIASARDYIAKRAEMLDLEKRLHEAQADTGEAYAQLSRKALLLVCEDDAEEGGQEK